MAQAATAKKAAAVEGAKVKRYSQSARFVGGDGAKVTIYLRENKKGAFNLGTTFKEPTKKAVTGCTDTQPTLDEAKVAFDKLVAVAVAHGWTKKEKKVRVPKAPAFTEATFPTAKPLVGGAALAFPKKGSKK